MPEARITKRTIDSLRPKATDYYVFDTETTGFGVRVRATGGMSYIVQYKAGPGRGAATRRVTLGAIGKMTPDDARKEASKILGRVAHGEDPAMNKRSAREAITIAQLGDLFISDHANAKRKASTSAYYKDIVDRLIKAQLGTMRAETVTRADLAKLHLKLKHTPYQANRVLAVISSMYAFGTKRGLVPEGHNPTRGIEKYREQGRERFLTANELERLGAAIREAEAVGVPWVIAPGKKTKHVPKKNQRAVISPHAAAALRLLILTGARLREILHLKWSEVDLQRGLLLLADSKTGKKAIVLNAPALLVLAELPRVGTFVIAGESAGTEDERPRSDLKRPWALVSRRAELDKVRIHDLRHTHASIGAGAGLGLPIIGKLLGHAQATTTQRYAHLDADPIRRASEMIGATLMAAMGDTKDKSKVVSFKK